MFDIHTKPYLSSLPRADVLDLLVFVLKLGQEQLKNKPGPQSFEAIINTYQYPFRILVLSNDSGLIEPILNTVSLHQVLQLLI